jgi:hypothetical protein
MTRGNPEALRRSADRKRQETLEKAERGIQHLRFAHFGTAFQNCYGRIGFTAFNQSID